MWGEASIIISCSKDSSYYIYFSFSLQVREKLLRVPKFLQLWVKVYLPTKLMDNLKNYVPHIIYHETLYSHISRWNMLQDFSTITYIITVALLPPIFEDKSVVKKFEPWFHCQTFHFTNHKCPWDFYMWSILPSLQVVANKDGCIWPKAISPDK